MFIYPRKIDYLLWLVPGAFVDIVIIVILKFKGYPTSWTLLLAFCLIIYSIFPAMNNKIELADDSFYVNGVRSQVMHFRRYSHEGNLDEIVRVDINSSPTAFLPGYIHPLFIPRATFHFRNAKQIVVYLPLIASLIPSYKRRLVQDLQLAGINVE